MEFDYIILCLKNGTIIIHGGYDLKLDAKGGNLVVENSLIEITIRPPLTEEEVLGLLREVREKYGEEAAEKLANILKTLQISTLSE